MSDKNKELVEVYDDSIFVLDTMLNDISNTKLEDVQAWLDCLYNKLKDCNHNIYRHPCTCWYCGHEIIWGCDYDYSDIYGDGEGIVSHLHCPHCGASIEYTLRTDEEEISMDYFEDKKEENTID